MAGGRQHRQTAWVKGIALDDAASWLAEAIARGAENSVAVATPGWGLPEVPEAKRHLESQERRRK